MDVDVKDNYGRTPLHIATCLFKADIVDSLLKYGADANALDENNDTPLTLGKRCLSFEPLWQLLVANIIKRNESAHPGFSINIAFIQSHPDVVKYSQKCQLELNEMKQMFLQNGSVYTLFKGNVRSKKIQRLIFGERLQEYVDRLSIYKKEVLLQIDKVVQRINLIKSGLREINEAVYLGASWWNKLPSELKYLILENFSNYELSKLNYKY